MGAGQGVEVQNTYVGVKNGHHFVTVSSVHGLDVGWTRLTVFCPEPRPNTVPASLKQKKTGAFLWSLPSFVKHHYEHARCVPSFTVQTLVR